MSIPTRFEILHGVASVRAGGDSSVVVLAQCRR